jgi:hypothetical protein
MDRDALDRHATEIAAPVGLPQCIKVFCFFCSEKKPFFLLKTCADSHVLPTGALLRHKINAWTPARKRRQNGWANSFMIKRRFFAKSAPRVWPDSELARFQPCRRAMNRRVSRLRPAPFFTTDAADRQAAKNTRQTSPFRPHLDPEAVKTAATGPMRTWPRHLPRPS